MHITYSIQIRNKSSERNNDRKGKSGKREKKKKGTKGIKNRGKGNKGKKIYFVCFRVYEYLPWI